jgi:NAD-dependent SIR2 family protein deacetylase
MNRRDSVADTPNLTEMTLPEFAREFPLRAPRLNLLIGAGASVSSGVPSAADLVWEFKRQIFATESGVHPSAVGMQVIPEVRESLDRFFAGKAGSPTPGATDEYSHYFEKAYPDAEVRRRFIDKRLDGAQPAHGYICLAALMKQGRLRIVWTTNFEDLSERAYSLVAEGKAASVVGRDTTQRMALLLRDERFPIVVKLHGDFRYDALRNTSSEIAACDAELRGQLVEVCRNYGLVVVGYSGRDNSVMDALTQALDDHGVNAFPEGMFWCVREFEDCPPRASALLVRAKAVGVRAAIVRIPDFDDFAAALYRACGLVEASVDARLAQSQSARAGYELLRSGKAEPVLKLGAIPVTSYPDTCYRFKAAVTTWPQLREITRGYEITSALHGGRVYAIGNRSAIQEAFKPHGLEDLQVAPITQPDLRAPDSKTLGMFYEALARGLTSQSSSVLALTGKKTRILFVKQSADASGDLASAFEKLSLRGARTLVRQAKDYWVHEAIELALEFREGVMWLLFRPTVFLTSDGQSPWEDALRKEVIRELLAQRYNANYSGLLSFWMKLLRSCSRDGLVRFPVDQEAGFEFRLENTLAVSYHRS